jgi:ABC-type tungstate transport system permease subunit
MRQPTAEPPLAISSTEINQPAGDAKMILATTTSTDDSGLLDYILPDLEAVCKCRVEVVAVGTGQAIQLGVDGNADVLLVHDRAKEDKFMTDGDGVRREDVMYNDFVIRIVDDPAALAVNFAADAFAKSCNRILNLFHVAMIRVRMGRKKPSESSWHCPEGSCSFCRARHGAVLTMGDETECLHIERSGYIPCANPGRD